MRHVKRTATTATFQPLGHEFVRHNDSSPIFSTWSIEFHLYTAANYKAKRHRLRWSHSLLLIMADALITWLRQSLPEEIARQTESHIALLEQGEYQRLLESAEAKAMMGTTALDAEESSSKWTDSISRQLESELSDQGPAAAAKDVIYFCIGYAALLAFLQSNVTGPPLSFSPPELAFGEEIGSDAKRTKSIREDLLAGLSIDGIAAYKLTPHVELLCLGDAVLNQRQIQETVRSARWARMRVSFMRQRLLSEVSSTLQDLIYDDLDVLAEEILGHEGKPGLEEGMQVEFLLERAAIHIRHGLDKLARADLEEAKRKRGFQYALTGLLGKRTKFQQKDTSQLVVLARSAEVGEKAANGGSEQADETKTVESTSNSATAQTATPVKLDLNDDTLLESISFSEQSTNGDAAQMETPLPPELASLDPSDQPKLDPVDSTILLSYASSITNTSPQHGLTREETLPYATRVLEGGSSNWQVYTQALLVRSRIEGYSSRTVERGLLQLQALVDQVISDTAGVESSNSQDTGATSFLPRPKQSESAPVTERLRYIFQLASPTRWDLEAELAGRWVQLGGLKSALEIYERLEMWAEAALCWAATEREDKAKKMVRRQLYHATTGGPDTPEHEIDEDEAWEGPERNPPPLDAPRLYCILGDLDQSVEMYEKAWEVSKQRYARAQRSLGRLYISNRDFVKAAEAYAKSLKVDQLNASSWFALGCALLEVDQFEKATEAFSRCVQLDDTDAEAWSNFAAALLRIEPPTENGDEDLHQPAEDEEVGDVPSTKPKFDAQKNRQDALTALKRAASLKHDSYRIWENVLVVSASLSPPDFNSALSAQRQIIKLRGSTDGEKCIDKQILQLIADHVMTSTDHYDPSQPGLARMFVKFMDADIVPLITGSADLWQLVSKLALWRNKPSSALDAEEKAWRAVTAQPGWETDNEKGWKDVVEATVRLCDSYESLGPRERTEGVGAGAGQPVAKDWKFKAKSAVRGVLGKGKASWEGSEGWERLQEVLEGLKGSC
jgi:tetratricopeptide (TPR) repeat protein